MSRKKASKTVQKPKFPWLWAGIGALVLVVVAVFVFKPAATTVTAAPMEISVSAAAQKYADDVFVLDVRQPEEWDQFHIPGATLIPLGELPDRVSEVPQDQEVVVVCRSGNRSQQGRDILRAAGYDQVSSMAGGMLAWQSAGYPTVSGP